MHESKILIVDDEEDIRVILSYNLEKEGYQVKTANRAKKGFKILNEWIPELIILDIMMPEMDGIQMCEKLRTDRRLDDTLIAFLTARGESFTQVQALDSGADDFITKPIKPHLLRSKVKSLLRRRPGAKLKSESDRTELVFDSLVINTDEFIVTVKGEEKNLAKKEFELLLLLVSKPNKVFKREEILTKVWGREVIVGDRTIDVHIRKLRKKIGKSYIKTVKGVGYKFKY